MYVCTQKIWQDLLHCVVQLNEPCPWKAFLVVDVWEHGPTINPIFVKWYVCSVWGKYGTVFQLCKKTYRWSTSIVTLVPPGIYPENMNALVHTPCVIAPYNFVCIQETVQWLPMKCIHTKYSGHALPKLMPTLYFNPSDVHLSSWLKWGRPKAVWSAPSIVVCMQSLSCVQWLQRYIYIPRCKRTCACTLGNCAG